jgi:uncharacterized protein with HEPN domain
MIQVLIDVLVELEPGNNVGLITLASMEIELGQILGYKVEIHTVKGFNPISEMKFWTMLRFNMSKHDDQICLRDMLDHAGEAVELLDDSTKEDLGNNRMMQLALARLLKIVGEAAKRVSTSTKQKNTDIPWNQIIGMRNRLIHGYDIIDYVNPSRISRSGSTSMGRRSSR